MKVEVIKNEEQEITYPCLMDCYRDGFVILLISRKKGVILTGVNKGQEISITNIDACKPFTGKLVLSNE